MHITVTILRGLGGVEPALPYSCHSNVITFHLVVTVGSQFGLVRGGASSARSSISRASGSGSDHRHQHCLWPNLYHSPTHGPHYSLRGLHMPLTLTRTPEAAKLEDTTKSSLSSTELIYPHGSQASLQPWGSNKDNRHQQGLWWHHRHGSPFRRSKSGSESSAVAQNQGNPITSWHSLGKGLGLNYVSLCNTMVFFVCFLFWCIYIYIYKIHLETWNDNP